MEEFRRCLQCGKLLEGRADKKFCDQYCRSTFNKSKNEGYESLFFKKIDKKLKLNRKLLKKYNQADYALVNKNVLESEGFDPIFFTSVYQNQNNKEYKFCYEYGFHLRIINGIAKYELITIRPQMFDL
jgi:hypothetical protein